MSLSYLALYWTHRLSDFLKKADVTAVFSDLHGAVCKFLKFLDDMIMYIIVQAMCLHLFY